MSSEYNFKRRIVVVLDCNLYNKDGDMKVLEGQFAAGIILK